MNICARHCKNNKKTPQDCNLNYKLKTWVMLHSPSSLDFCHFYKSTGLPFQRRLLPSQTSSSGRSAELWVFQKWRVGWWELPPQSSQVFSCLWPHPCPSLSACRPPGLRMAAALVWLRADPPYRRAGPGSWQARAPRGWQRVWSGRSVSGECWSHLEAEQEAFYPDLGWLLAQIDSSENSVFQRAERMEHYQWSARKTREINWIRKKSFSHKNYLVAGELMERDSWKASD